MKRLLLALPVFALGGVAGVVAGYALAQDQLGSPAERLAERVAMDSMMLAGPGFQPRADAEAAARLAHWTNLHLWMAASAYAQLRPDTRKALVNAARRAQADERFSVAFHDGVIDAARAEAARDCLLAGGTPKVVQGCVLDAIEEIQARYEADHCHELAGGHKVCRFPSGPHVL